MNFVLYNILDYLSNSDLILLNLVLKYNINQNYFFISELKISLQEIMRLQRIEAEQAERRRDDLRRTSYDVP